MASKPARCKGNGPLVPVGAAACSAPRVTWLRAARVTGLLHTVSGKFHRSPGLLLLDPAWQASCRINTEDEEQANALSIFWQGSYFSAASTCKKSPPLKFSSAPSAEDRMLLPWKRRMKLLSLPPPTPASAPTGNFRASSGGGAVTRC